MQLLAIVLVGVVVVGVSRSAPTRRNRPRRPRVRDTATFPLRSDRRPPARADSGMPVLPAGGGQLPKQFVSQFIEASVFSELLCRHSGIAGVRVLEGRLIATVVDFRREACFFVLVVSVFAVQLSQLRCFVNRRRRRSPWKRIAWWSSGRYRLDGYAHFHTSSSTSLSLSPPPSSSTVVRPQDLSRSRGRRNKKNLLMARLRGGHCQMKKAL